MSISIHALREESDDTKSATAHAALISIHALREESDFVVSSISSQQKFQSTLSVRRATICCASQVKRESISIHALREESDGLLVAEIRGGQYFNPRSP